jgi:hypothetical protein
MAGLDIDVSDRGEQRKFAVVMAVAISILGMVRWGIHWWRAGHMPESLPYAFFAVSVAFIAVGLVAPWALRPIFAAWMKFAMVINTIVTFILLSVAFFALFIPTRVIITLLKKDMLNRSLDAERESYWEEAEEQPEEFDRYLNHF